MKRRIAWVLALALLLSTLQLPVLAAETETANVTVSVTYGQTEARTMLDMINEFRTGDDAWVWNSDDTEKVYYTDLEPLTYDYTLEEAAMQRAAEIAVSYSHTRPNGESCFTVYPDGYNAKGENIAAGYNLLDTAQAAFEAWQETDEAYSGQGHRRSMLSENFTAVGIAYVTFNGTNYWVQEFGSDNGNTTVVIANDATTEVTVEILLNDTTVESLSASESSLSLVVGDTVSLPTVTATMSMTDTWPSNTTYAVTPETTWSVEDSTSVSLSEGSLTGLAVGETTLTASALGETVSVPVTVTPEHSYIGVITWNEDNTASATFTCERCGDEQTISATVTSETTDATCTEDGATVYTATATLTDEDVTCTDTKSETIAALGHNFENGTCTRCGTASPLDGVKPVVVGAYSKEQTSVKITWEAVEYADGYELYRATSADAADDEWTLVKTITSDKVSTYTNSEDGTIRYRNTDLTVGQTYYYRVRAYSGDDDSKDTWNYSDFSDVAYMPAAVVFNSCYSNSTSKIRLLWSEVSGSTGYQIWRQDEDGNWAIVKTLGDKDNTLTDDQGATTTYSNTGLTAGQTYTYKMRAFAIAEDGTKIFGTYSDEYTVAVMPEAVTLTGSKAWLQSAASLSWTEASGAAGYQIWMSESENGTYKIVKSITDPSTTSYKVRDLTSGTTYFFKTRAYTEVDGKKTFGEYSNTVSVSIS